MRLEENWGQLGMKYKLSEIMDIIGGGTPKTSKPEYWNGDIPWLSVLVDGIFKYLDPLISEKLKEISSVYKNFFVEPQE